MKEWLKRRTTEWIRELPENPYYRASQLVAALWYYGWSRRNSDAGTWRKCPYLDIYYCPRLPSHRFDIDISLGRCDNNDTDKVWLMEVICQQSIYIPTLLKTYEDLASEALGKEAEV